LSSHSSHRPFLLDNALVNRLRKLTPFLKLANQGGRNSDKGFSSESRHRHDLRKDLLESQLLLNGISEGGREFLHGERAGQWRSTLSKMNVARQNCQTRRGLLYLAPIAQLCAFSAYEVLMPLIHVSSFPSCMSPTAPHPPTRVRSIG
jgi:hypothetical protein